MRFECITKEGNEAHPVRSHMVKNLNSTETAPLINWIKNLGMKGVTRRDGKALPSFMEIGRNFVYDDIKNHILRGSREDCREHKSVPQRRRSKIID